MNTTSERYTAVTFAELLNDFAHAISLDRQWCCESTTAAVDEVEAKIVSAFTTLESALAECRSQIGRLRNSVVGVRNNLLSERNAFPDHWQDWFDEHVRDLNAAIARSETNAD